MCEYCNAKYFIQIEFTKPLSAPLTYIEKLHNELIDFTYIEKLHNGLVDLTGIDYLQIPIQYCPMCGRRLGEEEKQ